MKKTKKLGWYSAQKNTLVDRPYTIALLKINNEKSKNDWKQ